MAVDNTIKEADDVFEFLESLPDGPGSLPDDGTKVLQDDKPSAKTNNGDGKDEDILDFLNELEQSNLPMENKVIKGDGSTSSSVILNKISADSVKDTAETEDMTKTGALAASAAVAGQQQQKQEKESTEDELLEPLNDPITSLSHWWSSSGQATVSTLWSKTTERASQLKDRIAQEQHGIATKLNDAGVPLPNNFSAKPGMLAELTNKLTKFVVGDTAEVLRIHVVHDLINFHDLSYQIESQFDKILSSQVQGGVRIFVDQWDRPNEAGSEQATKRTYQLNLFEGKPTDGDKLCHANLENAIKLFQKAMAENKQRRHSLSAAETGANAVNSPPSSNSTNGQKDVAAAAAAAMALSPAESFSTSAVTPEDDNKISDVFIAILAVGQQPKYGPENIIDSTHTGSFNFTIALRDISNDVSLVVRSQGFPIRWVDWLEGNTKLAPSSYDSAISDSAPSTTPKSTSRKDLNEEFAEIDPSEWVKEWIDHGLDLSIGVLAQSYVIERMAI